MGPARHLYADYKANLSDSDPDMTGTSLNHQSQQQSDSDNNQNMDEIPDNVFTNQQTSPL